MRVSSLWIVLVLIMVNAGVGHSQTYSSVMSRFARAADKTMHSDSIKALVLNELGEDWEEYDVSDENERISRPRPIMLPSAVDQPDKREMVLKVSEVVDTLSGIWEIISADSPYSLPEASDTQTRVVQFSFYGTDQVVSVPQRYGTFHPEGISEKEVSEFWKSLSECEYQCILSDCNKYRIALGYNDWAVLKWVEALADIIFPQNIHSEQKIFTVFLMNHLGLRVKFARSDDKLVVLFSSMQQIYARKFVVIDTYPYYLAEDIPSASNVYTYRGEYGRITRPLDMRISKPLRIGDEKKLSVNKYSSVWEKSIDCQLPAAIIDFYSDYPQMDAKVYASSVPSPDFVDQIKGLFVREPGQDDSTYINRILSYMHLDFNYMVDQDQFGYEKPFFLEENFVYPYNDCEDRSIMLSVLLKQLLGLKVVLLDYDDHMCVAVNVNDQIKGDHLVINSEKYYVCDPTYIGATIGMCVPKYKARSAKVYLL